MKLSSTLLLSINNGMSFSLAPGEVPRTSMIQPSRARSGLQTRALSKEHHIPSTPSLSLCRLFSVEASFAKPIST